jgi:hypothetical protein
MLHWKSLRGQFAQERDGKDADRSLFLFIPCIFRGVCYKVKCERIQ